MVIMNNISIIICCGYESDSKNKELENDRLIKFTKCLLALNKLKFEGKDEVVISEFSSEPKLRKIASVILKPDNGLKMKYVWTNKAESEYFNQSVSKNAGTYISEGDIFYFINSDILLRSNALQVIREEFGDEIDDKFCVCMRHDLFLRNEEVDNFISSELNNDKNYHFTDEIKVQDPGWLYALDTLDIKYKVKIFTNSAYKEKMIHDFMSGYFVFGDCFAMSRNTFNKFPFDEKCMALTDVFSRDRIFNHNKNGYHLIFIQHKTACFHLSGEDYGAQTKVGSEKEKRLVADQFYLMSKYEELRHWAVFGYHKDFDFTLAQWYTKEQIKELIEKYRTPIYWQYFTDRKEFCQTYNVSEII